MFYSIQKNLGEKKKLSEILEGRQLVTTMEILEEFLAKVLSKILQEIMRTFT